MTFSILLCAEALQSFIDEPARAGGGVIDSGRLNVEASGSGLGGGGFGLGGSLLFVFRQDRDGFTALDPALSTRLGKINFLTGFEFYLVFGVFVDIIDDDGFEEFNQHDPGLSVVWLTRNRARLGSRALR